ncbi:MAG TPA: GNAT family N-acetyltransferase [Anaerolineaceae bacterium]|nr:GNAT family N-acetyltransferase [Anaerolineaceae bacterium]
MRTTHRPYSEELGDFFRLCRFVTDLTQLPRTHTVWCIGRLVDWKYGIYEGKQAVADFCARNAELWFDGFDELIGFAVSESGGTDFTITTRLGARFLYAELLDWVLAHWGGLGALSTDLTEHQDVEARALAGCGFQPDEPYFTRRFDLTREPPQRFSLEPGFTIVDLQSHPDYRAQRILRHDAFTGGAMDAQRLAYELEFYNHSIRGPVYHAPTDLCVMAPDGRFVAGCEALIDTRNAEAEIERVCTHSEFRQRGFARAVIQECLLRLHRMGIRGAYITGYSQAALALYGSLGAEEEIRVVEYTRG